MKSTSHLAAAALFICGVAGGLVYANMDAVESKLADANRPAHDKHTVAAPESERNQFGCHRHGALSYHCH